MGGPSIYSVTGDNKTSTHRTREKAEAEAIRRSKRSPTLTIRIHLTFVRDVCCGLYLNGIEKK